ncbi:hypothetical protein GGS24DRAFT_483653 [Hypoxylon argillaceum]|nr:hypothetical protein GGS24DRAFT_483653 [Hypoxylon argillaceum]
MHSAAVSYLPMCTYSVTIQELKTHGNSPHLFLRFFSRPHIAATLECRARSGRRNRSEMTTTLSTVRIVLVFCCGACAIIWYKIDYIYIQQIWGLKYRRHTACPLFHHIPISFRLFSISFSCLQWVFY